MLNVQLAISKCQIIYYGNLNNERVIIENCVTILHIYPLLLCVHNLITVYFRVRRQRRLRL